MEVKGNLVKEDRLATLAKFKNPVFKTAAEVIICTPPPAFTKMVQAKTLKVKQDAVDRKHKSEFEGEKRKWQAVKNTKAQEKAKKKAAKEAAKKAMEAQVRV